MLFSLIVDSPKKRKCQSGCRIVHRKRKKMNLNAELRPRRELLNPKFEGYKLNLDQLPIVSRELASKIVVFRLIGVFIDFCGFRQVP